ncbi:DUF4166 domain-containing protein [Microbacterium sp.]|uniref:DUF4166 domain-containing protein n=1 Tax=Microbacterium sp. TaxID=51671 RepID=UPI003F96BDBF
MSASPRSRDGSVFLAALGADADRLQPEVLEYVAGPPQRHDHGEGHGVFEVAGSPLRRLMLLLRPVVGPDLLVTRMERNVPFQVVNRPRRGDRATPALTATRTFHFRSHSETFVDMLLPGAAPGTVVDVLGRHRRIEILLECTATPAGNLSLRSRACRIRIARARIRLPRFLGVDVAVEDGYDPHRERRTIVAEVRNPIVGTVMAYRGWFRYAYHRNTDPVQAQYE